MKNNPTDSVVSEAACDQCGRFGALEMGDHWLCSECVTLAGSACAGSGADESAQ